MFLALLMAVSVATMFLTLSTAQAIDIEVSDDCSLADAITAANSDAVVGGCSSGDGADTIRISDDITLGATLPHITSEMTIKGGGFTINGAERFRIFAVNGGDLTIDNLTLTNGFADWGGAIVNVNSGELTVIDSIISHSLALEGGAIGNEGIVSITDSNLWGNSAKIGGAIHNIAGSLHLSHSSVVNNSAEIHDGGISSRFGVVVEIRNTVFEDNSVATFSGGAIGGGAKHFIDGCTFMLNSANSDGGAISISRTDAEVVISNSIFSDNSAGQNGGAIQSYGENVTILGNHFEGNFAEENGGAVYNAISEQNIMFSTFINNSAAKNGGAIYNGQHSWGIFAEQYISNSSIIGNRAGENGGGIYNSGDIEVRNIIVQGNHASGNGGGILTSSGKTYLSHINVIENVAGENGGGIYRDTSGTTRLFNSILAGNNNADCFGRLSENIANIGSDGSCLSSLSMDPMLGNLAKPEDGSLPYYPLLEGSPAIDAADSLFCPETDIIGTPRPQGQACDIGAFELSTDALTLTNMPNEQEMPQECSKQPVISTDGDFVFYITSISKDHITVRWSDMGKVLLYFVEISGGGTYDFVTPNAATTSHTFDGLQPDTEYVVSITSYLDSGSNPEAQAQVCTAAELR